MVFVGSKQIRIQGSFCSDAERVEQGYYFFSSICLPHQTLSYSSIN